MIESLFTGKSCSEDSAKVTAALPILPVDAVVWKADPSPNACPSTALEFSCKTYAETGIPHTELQVPTKQTGKEKRYRYREKYLLNGLGSVSSTKSPDLIKMGAKDI